MQFNQGFDEPYLSIAIEGLDSPGRESLKSRLRFTASDDEQSGRGFIQMDHEMSSGEFDQWCNHLLHTVTAIGSPGKIRIEAAYFHRRQTGPDFHRTFLIGN